MRPGQKSDAWEKQLAKWALPEKSTGPHLHYEVHLRGQIMNPVNYYFMDLDADDYDKMIEIAANHGKVFD